MREYKSTYLLTYLPGYSRGQAACHAAVGT